MANERLFIVKTEDGKELEPVSQETLVKWTEQGRITLGCKIRSTLVPNWDPAIEVPFLKPMLKTKLAEKVEEEHNTFFTRLKARINLRVEAVEATNGLVKTDVASYPTAELWIRTMAGITDLLILTAWAAAIYLACAWLFAKQILGPGSVFYMGFMFFWTTSLLYYILSMSLKTQTPGQKCWGIFLIRNNGEDFWMGRVFFYIMLCIPCVIFTPFFIYGSPSGRSLQEILTKTRMVKIVFDAQKRKRK